MQTSIGQQRRTPVKPAHGKEFDERLSEISSPLPYSSNTHTQKHVAHMNSFNPAQSSLAMSGLLPSQPSVQKRPSASWRQLFKQRCMDRIRRDRAQVIWNRRFGNASSAGSTINTDTVMSDSIHSNSDHKTANALIEQDNNDIKQALFSEMEQLFKESAMNDINADNAWIFESELLNELQNQKAQEEMMLFDEHGLEMPFEYLICPVCQHPSLATNQECIDCTGCNLSIKRHTPSLAVFHAELEHLSYQHKQFCHGILHAGFNDETGMFLMCTHCDEMIIL
ncbi:hypothetical protein BDV3_001808 [Batrachochytrium dendrobatidis]